MAKPIFDTSWGPDEGSEEDSIPSVNTAKFGDGYEQRTTKGLNPEVITWSISFTGNGDRILPIRAFLKARGGVESFQWTNPLSEVGLYVCRRYPLKKLSAGLMQMNLKFERVYEANI